MIRIQTVLCLAILAMGACKDVVVQDNTILVPGFFSTIHHYIGSYNDSKPLATGWYRIVDSRQGVARQLGTGVTYHLDPEPIMTASHFKTMIVESFPQDSTLWQVVVHLDDNGRERFAKATEESIGKDLVFVLEDSLWDEPIRVQAKIPNGVIVISKRQFSEEDAEELKRKIEVTKNESTR